MKPGDITAPVPGTGLSVGADSEAGYVRLFVITPGVTTSLTVPEVDQLIALLTKARDIVSTGTGDMEQR